MTEEQKDRLSLYREFGENAQKAYNFIFGTTQSNTDTHSIKDGIYIIYKDGSYELFNRKNKKEKVSKIGLVLGEKKICIGLKNKGTFYLTNNEDNERNRRYFDDSIDAFSDWNGYVNTKYIKSVGTDIPLNKGEFIPSIGQIGFINLFLKSINEALIYVGGEKIKGRYWSSTESSPSLAWGFDFDDSSPYPWHTKVSYTGHVRAVSEFPI